MKLKNKLLFILIFFILVFIISDSKSYAYSSIKTNAFNSSGVLCKNVTIDIDDILSSTGYSN